MIKGEAFKYVLYRYLLGFYPYAVWNNARSNMRKR